MTSRIRIFITASLIRHLLLVASLFTCQLPAILFAQNAPANGASDIAQGEEVTIKAHEQEKQGTMYRLRGDIEIDIRTYILRADTASYDSATGDIHAEGGVILDGGPHDLHIEASRALYNARTGTGTFFDAVGSIGKRLRGHSAILTSNAPFQFTGRQVDKLAGDRYVVHHGTITSCQLPHPKWTFNAETFDVIAGEDAKIYHTTFRVHGVPVFYFPFATHSVEASRKSGFTLPTIGQSSLKGFIFGESTYWAINRSMDATLGAEYFSKRGWAQNFEFRSRPGQNSFVNLSYYGVLDRGTQVTEFNPQTQQNEQKVQDQGGHTANLSSELNLAHDIRAVANVNYLSSFLFRVAWARNYTQTVNSEVNSVAFLAKNTNGFSFDLMGSRYENFQSVQAGDRILLVHAPSFESSSAERRIADSRFVWSYDTTAEGVSRREPGFVTNSLFGRLDVSPRMALPLYFKGWGFRTEAGLRDTWYDQQKLASSETQVGAPVDEALNRRSVEGLIELRPPALARVFDHEVAGRKIKHVIEPRVIYDYVGGVENFQNIIRTDARDILSNTSQVEMGIVHRLFVKSHVKRDPVCDLLPAKEPEAPKPGEYLPGTNAEPLNCDEESTGTREVLTWEVKERHYFNNDFGNALVLGHRNVLTATADFTSIAFLTGPRTWSPVVSRLRVRTTPNTDVQWELAYDSVAGRINSSTAFINYRIGEIFVGGSQAFLRVPGEVTTTSTVNGNPVPAPQIFNQYRALVGYGHPGKRGLSAGGSLGYDHDAKLLQYGAVQTSYNWDCCGLSFEYRRFAPIGTVRKGENQFRFAFSLLNVGSFGNLRRQERLF